ncbi:MAG: ADP-glyceromanno-heptose 6-epimerase [Rhodospirillales bacterium]|nr:ADP-glyceromanno-heptose 6-epimerase [Rhodospirillales bacterium]
MYVVTGGAGFIGSNIVAALDERQPGSVLVCDRLRDGVKWSNLATRELIDIVPPEELFAFLDRHARDVEAVIHMGAISSTVETDADRIFVSNYRLSLGLWQWCARHQVRLIYASSAATYGDGARGFDDDGDPKALAALRPLNAYGWSKNLFDRRVARLLAGGETSPPQWAGLKFFNVYGPNEYHKGDQRSVAVQIYERISRGEAARLFKSHRPDYGDGGQLRDFIWVGDCVDIVLWLLDHPGVSGLFNCGTGKARSFADLAAAVFAAADRKPKIEYVPMPETLRAKYQYFTEARMDRLRAAGYGKPFTTLEEGVRRYVRDYLAQADRHR